MKKVIVYFSQSGNTKCIAEIIKKHENCDIMEIITETPYVKEYNKLIEVAKEEINQGYKPPIENIDVSGYDIIYLGTPNWWSTIAPPVSTFLTENNLEGKTIIPFITHGGGGNGTIEKDIKLLAPKSEVLSAFSTHGKGNSTIEDDIGKWID